MTQLDIVIRPVREDDIPSMLALWRATESGPSVTDTPEHLAMLVREAPDLFLAADDAGRIVGSVLGGWDLWRGHIYRLAVHPDYQRRGIARRLVAEIEARLRARGAVRIYALALPREAAEAFWRTQPYEASEDVALVRTFRDAEGR
jgi:ribosomal protein S18 acetylase RimI-like enzyme